MKRTPFVAAAVLTLVTLASCGKSDEAPQEAAQPAGGMQMPWANTVMPEKRFDQIAKEYKSDYVETAQVQQCLAQSVHSCVSQTVMSKAQETSDVKICEDLSEPSFRANCKNMVINAKAIKEADPALCGDLEEYARRSCVSQSLVMKAKNAGSTSVCQEYRKFFPIEKTASGSENVPMPGAWTEESLSSEIRNCSSTVLIETAKSEKDCDALKGTMPFDACVSNYRMRSQMNNPASGATAAQPAATATAPATSTGTAAATVTGTAAPRNNRR